MKKHKHSKKKFNIMEYKGYLLILGVLCVLLFVLVRIAVGMICDEYFSGMENVSETEIETEELSVFQRGYTEEKKQETEFENETENLTEAEDSLLILVNRDHPMPEDAEYTLVQIEEHYYIDARAYDDLTAMMTDAKAEGHDLLICSAWRSHYVQEQLYERKIDEYLSYGYSQEESEELAAFWVAIPGTSEHEIGLAVDIVSESNQNLDHSQIYTDEQQWLMQHCHEYGFILRYPEDKQEITQIGYEPWHYRYVGKEAAKEIMEQGICLEEYLSHLK